MLSKEELDQFENEGFVYIPSFYDLEEEILPIQNDIYDLISILIKKYNLPIEQKPFSSKTFDSGLQELLKDHRELVSTIYDAV